MGKLCPGIGDFAPGREMGGTKTLEALRQSAPSQGMIDAQDRTCSGCGSNKAAGVQACDGSVPQDVVQEAPPNSCGDSARCEIKQHFPACPVTELACNKACKKANAEPGYDGHCRFPWRGGRSFKTGLTNYWQSGDADATPTLGDHLVC